MTARAYARTTDPVSSWEAAESLTAISELRKLGHLQVAGYGRPHGSTRRTMILQPTRKETT